MEPLKHLLFIDIETACCEADHAQLSEGMQREWARKVKVKWNVESEEAPQAFFDKAGILAEFGRIVCISMGCLVEKDKEWKLKIRSFAGDDEKALLEDFCKSISKFSKHHNQPTFVGHN